MLAICTVQIYHLNIITDEGLLPVFFFLFFYEFHENTDADWSDVTVT